MVELGLAATLKILRMHRTEPLRLVLQKNTRILLLFNVEFGLGAGGKRCPECSMYVQTYANIKSAVCILRPELSEPFQTHRPTPPHVFLSVFNSGT